MNDEPLLAKITELLEEKKGQQIECIDVRNKCSFADYMVIATGTSSRHVKSLANEVAMLSKKGGLIPLGVEGADVGEWALVDLGDIIVHIMQVKIRETYQLEKLWTVGPEV
jgi:ribosome-associated protein|tara:strand:- start:8824 stop:9156 length:333 start_codon:yes stop_codon:yes gene_type:complete